jgi:hypothetical protein
MDIPPCIPIAQDNTQMTQMSVVSNEKKEDKRNQKEENPGK